MSWVYLIALSLALWGGCGATIGIGRRIWSLGTTLKVHLAVATVLAFLAAAVHAKLNPSFAPALRAAVMTGLIIALDAGIVAPLFERSYAMFRSLLGTWIPFAAIFAASWAAGLLIPA